MFFTLKNIFTLKIFSVVQPGQRRSLGTCSLLQKQGTEVIIYGEQTRLSVVFGACKIAREDSLLEVTCQEQHYKIV